VVFCTSLIENFVKIPNSWAITK